MCYDRVCVLDDRPSSDLAFYCLYAAIFQCTFKVPHEVVRISTCSNVPLLHIEYTSFTLQIHGLLIFFKLFFILLYTEGLPSGFHEEEHQGNLGKNSPVFKVCHWKIVVSMATSPSPFIYTRIRTLST